MDAEREYKQSSGNLYPLPENRLPYGMAIAQRTAQEAILSLPCCIFLYSTIMLETPATKKNTGPKPCAVQPVPLCFCFCAVPKGGCHFLVPVHRDIIHRRVPKAFVEVFDNAALHTDLDGKIRFPFYAHSCSPFTKTPT